MQKPISIVHIQTMLCELSDHEIVNNMYETEAELLAGESAEEETEDSIMSPIPIGPLPLSPRARTSTPKRGLHMRPPSTFPTTSPSHPTLN
ncbi:hypothetical protein E2320_006416 [Naja naja]|nr:hypothetical protein E2320_006416 [Naja naja]